MGSYLCHNESRAYILQLNSPGSFRWTHDTGEWITGAWKVLDESVHLEATNSDKGELGEDYSKIIYKVAGRGGCASNPFCGGGNWDAGWALKGPVSGGGSASRWRRWAGFCHPR